MEPPDVTTDQGLAGLLTRARREGIVVGEPIRVLPSTSGFLNDMHVIEYLDGTRYYWKRFLSRPESPWLEPPEDRMLVEARALQAFREVLAPNMALPIVLMTDKMANWLLLSDVCPNRGGNWQQAFLEGEPEISFALAETLGAAFAKLACSFPTQPLRGNFDEDAAHWGKWLRLRTIAVLHNDPPISELSKRSVSELHEEGSACTQRCLLHVDFIPKNIVISPNEAGLVDFELSTSMGDVSSELGFFLGHIGLLLVNRNQTMNPTWTDIIDRLATSYLSISQLEDAQHRRVMRYAGVAILYRVAGAYRGTFLDPNLIARQLELAEDLLTASVWMREYPDLLRHHCGTDAAS